MNKIREQIKHLSPEKRALLAEKIREKKGETRGINSREDFRFSTSENFCCDVSPPGNLQGLSFRPLERLPPGTGEIEIKAEAVSINFRDLMIALGIYPPTPGMPSVMGSDYAGRVTAVGDEVKDFKVGDEVIALGAGHLGAGGHFSAYTTVFESQAVLKPASLSFPEAACIPTVFLTAYYSLHYQARLERGESILIHSASGGVGLAAIQVAGWCGAGRIFATAGTPEKRSYLSSLGIEIPLDSRSTKFASEISTMTRGQGVDVILNSLAGDAVQKGLEILNFFGRFLQIDKRDIHRNAHLELGCFKKGLAFYSNDMGIFLKKPALLKRLLLEITDKFASGAFHPLPFKKFPVRQTGEALALMSRAKHIGKLVLEYPNP